MLVDVDHTMECMREETFGPTLPIMQVRDAEEAIRLANDSPYGLAASVFTRDVARGEAIARRMHAGAVCVNDALINYSALELPMGGVKASGLGARHGAGGIRKFCASRRSSSRAGTCAATSTCTRTAGAARRRCSGRCASSTGAAAPLRRVEPPGGGSTDPWWDG